MIHKGIEQPWETSERLAGVLRTATFEALDGYFSFRILKSIAETPPDMLAVVRNADDTFGCLAPTELADEGALRVFSISFENAPRDNSGFIGWLATLIRTACGTGVVVVCGFDPRRGGIFDYWAVSAHAGEDVLAALRRWREDVSPLAVPAPLIDHLDLRVSNAAAVQPVFDALARVLGLRSVRSRIAKYAYARSDAAGIRRGFINVVEEPSEPVSATRIAFTARNRAMVDSAAEALRAAGAIDCDGPLDVPEYHSSYYGFFFSDQLGNPYEVCYHRIPAR